MNHLLTIDPSVIDWSRAQFALTAIYHWLFVPLTLGLAVVMGIIETIYYRTGKPFWREAARFWQRLFGGEEQKFEHHENHEELDEDDRPQHTPHGHLSETVCVEPVDTV